MVVGPVGTLLPVIGLVKVGAHAIADRYGIIHPSGCSWPWPGAWLILTAHWARRAVPLALGAAAVCGWRRLTGGHWFTGWI